MPVTGFDYLDLGGGVDQGSDPSRLPPNRQTELLNFYPFETRLKRRGGMRRLTNETLDDKGGGTVYGLVTLRGADGVRRLIVAGTDRFATLDGDAFTLIPQDPAFPALPVMPNPLSPTGGDPPWILFPYKGSIYALRNGAGLLRISSPPGAASGLQVYRAGMAAPTSAMTIADGGAGALVAGDYRTVVTFYNTDHGLESNPSPVSNTLTLAGGRKIDYSGIPISPSSFVNARRIYRTLENQQGTYFFVRQIDDNLATTLTGEQVTVDALGRSVSFDNGEPSLALKVGAIHQEQLFASDGRTLFASNYLQPEGFKDDAFLSVFEDDGNDITGLFSFRNERLIIGKSNRTYYLVGSFTAGTIYTLDDSHGVASHHSMQSAGTSLFWFGSGPSVMRWDGGGDPTDIGNPRVKAILDSIPAGFESHVVGAIVPSRNSYLLSIPQEIALPNGATTIGPALVLSYNYKTDAWSVFTFFRDVTLGGVTGNVSTAPLVFGDFLDDNLERTLYSSEGAHIYSAFDETYNFDRIGDSDPKRIVASMTTRRDEFGYPGYRKFFRSVWAKVPTILGSTLRFEVFADEDPAAILDRTVDLGVDVGGEWKSYALSTAGRPATTMQARISYSGVEPVTLDALHFNVGILSRRPGQAR